MAFVAGNSMLTTVSAVISNLQQAINGPTLRTRLALRRLTSRFAREIFLPPRRTHAFSLVELLAVMAVFSLLIALLLPVFLSARGKARQAVCSSHLHQVGLGLAMYIQDHDGSYPYAVDPVDRIKPTLWGGFPKFAAAIPQLESIQQVLQPYIHSANLLACPADVGCDTDDFAGATLNAYPTSYEKYGTSYSYRTELAARQAKESSVQFPAQVNVLFDEVGFWHGTLIPLELRYNVLFADGHTKNLTYSQIEGAWNTPL